jgi:hypothetical protein
MAEWEVGQKVSIPTRDWDGHSYHFGEVVRVTGAQVIVRVGREERRYTLHGIRVPKKLGGNILPFSEEHAKVARRRSAERTIRHFETRDLSKYPDAAIFELADLIAKLKKEQAGG